MNGSRLSRAQLLGLGSIAAATLGFSQPTFAQLATTFCGLPNGVSMHALTTDNTVVSLSLGGAVTSVRRITGIDGNLLGIDFRPSDGPKGVLYGITDTGKVYSFLVDPTQPPGVRLVSRLPLRFAGGFQSLADFNPVVSRTASALRVIGSNDENFAIVDSGAGPLTSVVAQTPMAYVGGDASFGISPNLTAGAYNNNLPSIVFTTFYGIDYHLDTLVTIADRTADGNSNTAGGQLKTIGPIVDPDGIPINFAPNAGMDIFTLASSIGPQNYAVLVGGSTLYCLDLKSFDDSLPPGSLQKVVARPQSIAIPATLGGAVISGGLIDIALTAAPIPPPPPKPIPIPSPPPTAQF